MGLPCWLWGVGRLMVVVVDVGLQCSGSDVVVTAAITLL